MTCRTCGAPRETNRNFCPKCKHVYDLKELRGVKIQDFKGRFSLKLEKFWETGDPEAV